MLADICVFAIVMLFVWLGYRSGLMKAFIKVASYVISIVISYFLYPHVTKLLMKTPIYTYLVDLIGKNYSLDAVTDSITNDPFGIFSNYIGPGMQSAAEGISQAIANLAVNVIAFILLLILTKILIRIVGNILGIFTKLPVIKQFNRLGGALFGGVSGVFVLYLICAVLILYTPINPNNRILYEIQNSTFASEIYENNPIVNFLGK